MVLTQSTTKVIWTTVDGSEEAGIFQETAKVTLNFMLISHGGQVTLTKVDNTIQWNSDLLLTETLFMEMVEMVLVLSAVLELTTKETVKCHSLNTIMEHILFNIKDIIQRLTVVKLLKDNGVFQEILGIHLRLRCITNDQFNYL